MDKIMFVDKIPAPDEEGFVLSVERHPGGSAANTIVGLSRLGTRTGCIGRVGNDPEGMAMIHNLESEGVETRGIRTCDGRSGVALSFVDEKGLRALLIDPGINDTIPFEDIDREYLQSFDLVHLTSFICKSNDLSFQTQLALANTMDVPLSFDPGQLYAERGLESLRSLIKKCRVVMPNQRELRMMTGLGPEKGARKLLSTGAGIVVVKMGLKGSYVTDGRSEKMVPAYGGRGLDTTGAGDAFNAGFIHGMLNGMPPSECAELGAKVAWFSVQKPGARDGLPLKSDLEALGNKL